VHPDEPGLDFLAGLKRLGGLLSVEPFRPAAAPPDPERLRALLESGDLFSPNLLEARSLLGPGRPEELLRGLLDLGARQVCLRMGAAGALVSLPGGRAAWIPAPDVAVANPVGAGNAVCGGCLAGGRRHEAAVAAGRGGAAAASFLLESPAMPVVSASLRAAAQARVEHLQAGVQYV
jgi:sugar/nucleoside kinase (ribokinase family)